MNTIQRLKKITNLAKLKKKQRNNNNLIFIMRKVHVNTSSNAHENRYIFKTLSGYSKSTKIKHIYKCLFNNLNQHCYN